VGANRLRACTDLVAARQRGGSNAINSGLADGAERL
jgi:hypothetical protein